MLRYHLYCVTHLYNNNYEFWGGLHSDTDKKRIETTHRPAPIPIVQLCGNYALINNDCRLHPTYKTTARRYLVHEYNIVNVDFSKLPQKGDIKDIKVLDTAPSGFCDNPHIFRKTCRPDGVAFLRGGALLKIGHRHFWHFQDDKVFFTLKVPPKIKTVKDAESYFTPSEVKEIQKTKPHATEVYRFGELWFIQRNISLNFRETKLASIPQTNSGGKQSYKLKLRKFQGKLYTTGRVSHQTRIDKTVYNHGNNTWENTVEEKVTGEMRGFYIKHNVMEVIKNYHGKI